MKKDKKERILLNAVNMIAQQLQQNKSVFPYGINGKDYEQTFLYAFSLIEYCNFIGGEKLAREFLVSPLSSLIDTMEEQYACSEEQLETLKNDIPDYITFFIEALDGFVKKKSENHTIQNYASVILSRFPSAKEPFELSEEYTRLLDSLVENIAFAKSTYEQLTNEPYIQDTSEKGKKNFMLIACLIALICSLGFNIYQHTKIQSVEERNTDEVIYWATNYNEEYSAHRGAVNFLEEIKDEYFFYHDYAVIVSSPGGTKYHKYGCSHLGDRFYIYNIENARAQGYTACADCEPDKTLTSASSQLKKQMINEHIENFSEKPMGPYKP